MNGEEGVKAAFGFLHAMRKIETMAPTTQEELDAIKEGILNMACVPDSKLTADKADNYRLPTDRDPMQIEFVWEGKRWKGVAFYDGEVNEKATFR